MNSFSSMEDKVVNDLDIAKEYRGKVFLKNASCEYEEVKLERWGAGEYKLSKDFHFTMNETKIYVPYLTYSTLEKAFVVKRFLEKQGIIIAEIKVGYFSYSRQERETVSEPMLLDGLMTATKALLGVIKVVDIHDTDSLPDGVLNVYMAYKLAQAVKELGYSSIKVVAPDKGAAKRLMSLRVQPSIIFNKTRANGQVTSEVGEVNNINDGDTLMILDDMCDGGRTFAVAAEKLHELFPNSKVVLAVTHAILPFGIELLKEKGIDKVVSSDTCFPKGEHFGGFLEVI